MEEVEPGTAHGDLKLAVEVGQRTQTGGRAFPPLAPAHCDLDECPVEVHWGSRVAVEVAWWSSGSAH